MWIKFGKYEPVLPDFQTVQVTEPWEYMYEPSRKSVTVPVGFKSDGASIPDYLESLAGNNLQGGYVPAALVHDWLCYNALELKTPLCSWDDTHRIFYQAMLDNGVPKGGLKGAWLKYQAVKVGMFFKRWKYNG